MSDLSCNNCGKDAELGYCRECDEGTNDYCADLRKQVKRAQAWAKAWKAMVKRERASRIHAAKEASRIQKLAHGHIRRAARLEDERDAAQKLVETHEATIAERDTRIKELEAALDDARWDFMKIAGSHSKAVIPSLRVRAEYAIAHIDAVHEPIPFEDVAQESGHAPAELSTQETSEVDARYLKFGNMKVLSAECGICGVYNPRFEPLVPPCDGCPFVGQRAND